MGLYKKFNKLPITLAEATENFKAAKEMWVTKFVRKTARKKHFAPGREEWADRNYELSEAELISMPAEVLLGAFADVQGDLPMDRIIDEIRRGCGTRGPQDEQP